MKKITRTITLTAIATLGAFAFVLPAMASTVSLSPTTVHMTKGQTFNVTVGIDPQGVSNYAEQVQLNYPANLVQVSSFTLGSTWIALTQSGYDSIDNTNGVMIKTAGYPAGFSSAAAFGTVTFKAIKTGSGSISIGNGSLAYIQNGQGALTGSGTSFSVTAPAVAPVSSPTVVTPSVSPQPTTPAPTPAVAQIQPTSQLASVNASVSSGFPWVTVLIVILVVLILGYAAYIIIKKNKSGGARQ